MPKDKRPSVYGVDEYIEPNMVDQLMYPLKGIETHSILFVIHLDQSKLESNFTGIYEANEMGQFSVQRHEATYVSD